MAISYIRYMLEIEKGLLLIAEPFLKDENFQLKDKMSQAEFSGQCDS